MFTVLSAVFCIYNATYNNFVFVLQCITLPPGKIFNIFANLKSCNKFVMKYRSTKHHEQSSSPDRSL